MKKADFGPPFSFSTRTADHPHSGIGDDAVKSVSMAAYNHTQPGNASRFSLGAMFVLVLFAAVMVGPRDPQAIWTFGLIALLLFVTLLLFHCLTVEIARGYLRLKFGVGLIRKSFRIKEIENAEPIRTRWWYGWGIRLTPHGWLFSVSGFDAVKITLRNGRRYAIGTDEPDKLIAAIEAAGRYS